MKFTKTTKQHGEQRQSQYERYRYINMCYMPWKPRKNGFYPFSDYVMEYRFVGRKGIYGSVLYHERYGKTIFICTARWATEYPPSYESLKAQ